MTVNSLFLSKILENKEEIQIYLHELLQTVIDINAESKVQLIISKQLLCHSPDWLAMSFFFKRINIDLSTIRAIIHSVA